MTSSLSRRVRKAGEEMELLCCVLLCRKCGGTGVSVQIHHPSAAVLLWECFCLPPSPCHFFGGEQKGTVGMGQKERAVLSVWKSGIISFPMMVVIFKGSFSPLGKQNLDVQLGRFLEVIFKCMAALRAGTVC